MMTSKKDREAMLKAIGKVENKWEFLAFIFAFRQKELWKTIAGISLLLNIIFIVKFTDMFETILNYITGLFK